MQTKHNLSQYGTTPGHHVYKKDRKWQKTSNCDSPEFAFVQELHQHPKEGSLKTLQCKKLPRY